MTRFNKHILITLTFFVAIFLIPLQKSTAQNKTRLTHVKTIKKVAAKKKRKKRWSNVNYRKKPILDSAVGYASFYSDKFIGRKTANGEKFSQQKMTCAHNTFKLGTFIRVTNLSNQQSIIVKVNDRLHHNNPRLVDLSKAAAKSIGFRHGVIKVLVEKIKQDSAHTGPK